MAGPVYPDSLDHSHHLILSRAHEDQAETYADDIVQIAVTNPTFLHAGSEGRTAIRAYPAHVYM